MAESRWIAQVLKQFDAVADIDFFDRVRRAAARQWFRENTCPEEAWGHG